MRVIARARAVAALALLALMAAGCGVRRVAELTPTTIELLVLSPIGRPLAATVDVGTRRYATDGLLRLRAPGPLTVHVSRVGYGSASLVLNPGTAHRLVLYPVAHTN